MPENPMPRSPKLRRLYHDWKARCLGRFPKRGDFDPMDLAYILGDMSLIEVHRDPLRFRFRVHGTSLAEKFGSEYTGKFVDEMPNTEYTRIVTGHFTEVVMTGWPMMARLVDDVDGYRQWDAEALVLPLSRNGDELDMLFGAVVHYKPLPVLELVLPHATLVRLVS
jgi:hypothetical protein